MPWSYFIPSQWESLKNLIEEREYCCMNFSAQFRKKYFDFYKYRETLQLGSKVYNGATQNCEAYPVKDCENKGETTSAKLIHNNKSKKIIKADDIIVHHSWIDNLLDFSIMLSENGQLLPVYKKTIPGRIINLNKGLEIFDNSLSKVHTVIGDKKSVKNILKTCFNEKTVSDGINSFNYYAMALDKQSFKPCNSSLDGINIRLGIQKDLENLMPLQKNYEIEEVLPRSEMFNKAISKKHLSTILKNQTTVIAEKSGKIIAKANTNEKGFIYQQIGGVYTLPEYRNMNISTALVSSLLENIFSKDMKASLFVKINNPAALKVYTKLGFKIMEEFQITYFLYQ